MIIQIGDIVRMSNDSYLDSLECAEMSDTLMRKNPNNWIQLYGNHESPFIDGPYPKVWDGRGPFIDCDDIVNSWWEESLAFFAVGIQTADGFYVVTHAGLTKGYMSDVLKTSDPHTAIKRMNEICHSKTYAEHYEIGAVNFGLDPNHGSDILWAASGAELLPSWEGSNMGFNQIHGHDTVLFSWEYPHLRDPLPYEYEDSCEIDFDQRLIEITTKDDWKFLSVDWVLKEFPNPDTSDWGILQFEGEIFL